MKDQDLFQLFIDELGDMYSSERQIIESFPKLIHRASLTELKQTLKKHLKETENHLNRLEEIFFLLDLPPEEKKCEAMEGLLRESENLTENKIPSPALDAAIISATQKIEHYEMASYGILRSFAKTLDLGHEIVGLFQENLDEERAADKKLTKIAEGSFFRSGVNKEAVYHRLK